MILRCGRYPLNLARPRVMGILNVTPDSFADRGRWYDPASALAYARQMIDDGADIIDIGGESTRPGAEPVSDSEELDRVLPLVEALAKDGALVSVDTMKPAVMRAAIAAGVSMINDVKALQAPGALEVAANGHVAVCLMHMQGEPRTMQHDPRYTDVVAEVKAFLSERVAACLAAGIAPDRIVVDPGFGFGKSFQHNLALLRALPEIVAQGSPVLAQIVARTDYWTPGGGPARREPRRRPRRRRARCVHRAGPRSQGDGRRAQGLARHRRRSVN